MVTKKKLSTITAAMATIAVIAGIGAVGPLQQQIAFAQGVDPEGEEVSFDDVKVVDGEEVIEVGIEEDGEGAIEEEEPEIDEEQQAAIEIADQAVHEAFPPEEGEEVSEEDVLFHQGLCAVGISTEALDELGGCEVLPPFGEDD
jgi:hypothetical protein